MSKFAIVCIVCNHTNYVKQSGNVQLYRSLQLGKSVHEKKLDKILITNGFPRKMFEKHVKQGWQIVDVSNELKRKISLIPIYKQTPGLRWNSKSLEIQMRQDYACTSLKFMAWNFTQYDRILVSDTDVCFYDHDIYNWMDRHRKWKFIAEKETARRGFVGIQSHLMYIKPNEDIFDILVELGKFRSFLPYTNGDQDIIESIYAAKNFPPLPNHKHWITRGPC